MCHFDCCINLHRRSSFPAVFFSPVSLCVRSGGKGTDESETEAYYHAAVTSGAFRINGARVAPSYLVREGDRFQHYLHRHETPVAADPPLVRYEDARLLVVDKPSSMPAHPCGNFRHNSLLYILAAERGLRRLFVVHRLDAVTSGLLLLAKDAHTARRLSQQIGDKEVRKEYVARVQGHFPESMKDYVVSLLRPMQLGSRVAEAGL